MSIVAVDTITDAAGGNTASINGIPLRQGVIDPENRIINGAFDFWQRGTSFTASAYGADRWLNLNNGGTVTMSKQAFAMGETLGSNNPRFFLRQNVSGQSGTNIAFVQQRMEGVETYAGQTVTVLGWARRSSGTGDVRVGFTQFFGSGGSPSASVVVSAQPIALSGSFEPFAATISIPSVSGKVKGSDGNDFLEMDLITSDGGGALGIQTIGVDLWGIHIKLGVHTADATALYKQPELGPELARCQRYYESQDIITASSNFGGSVGGPALNGRNWAVVKRATPTVAVGSFGSGSGMTVAATGENGWRQVNVHTTVANATVTADAEL